MDCIKLCQLSKMKVDTVVVVAVEVPEGEVAVEEHSEEAV